MGWPSEVVNLVLPLFLLLELGTHCIAVDRSSFPPGFEFGFSTSAYQVEGAAHEDGRGLSIWDTFSCIPGNILGGGNGDVAADVYHRYKEDVQVLKSLGTDVYRFSISWARIFPGGSARHGKVNPKGVQYYNNLINELLQNGIEPFVTIFHWDVPQVLENEYGGFRSKRIIDDYSEFAEFCFKEFGDRVRKWVTVNEPSIFATHGYGNGKNAPGRCTTNGGNCAAGDSSREPYIVAHNLLLAHMRAVKIYRSKYQQKQKGVIGISLYADWYLPYSSSKLDVDATQRVLDNKLGLYLDPLVFGDYPYSVKQLVRDRLPVFSEEESKEIRGSFDFIGLNYYMSSYVMDNSTSSDPTRKSDIVSDPGQDAPESPDIPDTFATTTSYVTLDNGQPLEDILEDADRIQYIKNCLGYTLQAMREGADVRGLLLWSYIDNFEWNNGYSFRLGLHYVNYTNNDLRRIPKASAIWFQQAMNPRSFKIRSSF